MHATCPDSRVPKLTQAPSPPAAKEYLGVIKQYAQDEGEEGASDDEEGGAPLDAVSQRLRADALEGMGHLQRKLAHRLELPDLPRVSDFDARSSGRFFRGHRLAVTGVALTADDATVYSVSKDGTILQTDVETGKR
jgi:ribosomal RNA-processing protein 9